MQNVLEGPQIILNLEVASLFFFSVFEVASHVAQAGSKLAM